MHLRDVPLAYALAGLALYTVLGGADFGAGWWQLTAGTGPKAGAIRTFAHRAMAPVWEANHVWLIFVLTVFWTAYPVAFASVASTLSIPLFLAAVGIILRGAAYALRSGASGPRELGAIDTVFSFSSVCAPFALGAAVGGIASLRVPIGNATGDLVTSWLNPTSALIGTLAVAAGAYTAAVFLAGDAARNRQFDLEERFRRRALTAGLAAGALALGGIAVLRVDAHALYRGLVHGPGLAALAASVAAGTATLMLVRRRRYDQARFSAAVAVAAIVAGWALAQAPLLLPGLTVAQAAAPRDVLVAITIAVPAAGVIVFPWLALLFRLALGGSFDAARTRSEDHAVSHPAPAEAASRSLARAAIAFLISGVGLTTVADAGWAHALGVVCLLAFVPVAFPSALPPQRGGGTGGS
ncbi:MAG: cytochrome d ubiquinol oxidase subunit II [Gaiellaceae bacterium]